MAKRKVAVVLGSQRKGSFSRMPGRAMCEARIRASDAVLFVTPEYNRSVPGVLKNAIDVASRPYGQSAWAKKPAAVVSVSPGELANPETRESLRTFMAPFSAWIEANTSRTRPSS